MLNETLLSPDFLTEWGGVVERIGWLVCFFHEKPSAQHLKNFIKWDLAHPTRRIVGMVTLGFAGQSFVIYPVPKMPPLPIP